VNTGVVALSNGTRTIWNALIDLVPYNSEIQETLVIACTYMMNSAQTRQFIRPETELQVSLALLLS